ncbi:MAG: EAL domain-containing protein [Nitrospinae bacterium]|nr:EAL domain-containing protein [Nitrospinota bacterium]
MDQSSPADDRSSRFRQVVGTLRQIRGNQETTPDQKLTALLRLGADLFGMEGGMIGAVRDARLVVEQLGGPGDLFKIGESLPLTDSRCAAALAVPAAMVCADLTATDAPPIPCLTRSPVGAWFGFPLLVDGAPYGTVAFFSSTPRTTPFDEEDLALLELFALWGGAEIAHARRVATLERETQTLNAAQAVAHIGSWDWNILTGALAWSDEIYRIFGVSPQEFAATYDGFLQAIHPDDRGAVVAAVNATVADPTVAYDIPHRVVRADGSVRFVREQGEVYRNARGIPVRMLGTVIDETEKRESEERLHLARRVFESVGEAILITDPQAKILDVNPSFERITGYSLEDARGQNPSMMQSGRHDVTFYRNLWRTLVDTGAWTGEIWDRRKGGALYPKKLTINAITDPFGAVVNYVGVFSDISVQKRTEAQLEQLAYYDPLTRLPNRALFRDRLDHALSLARRNGTQVALLFIDLDRFKNVNDSMGHSVGDELLVEVAQRIRGAIRETDTLSRLGGDEFTLIFENVTDPLTVDQMAAAVIAAIGRPFTLRDRQLYIGASVGIALFPDDAGEEGDAETLVKNADTAMYQAKAEGRGTHTFFTGEMNRKVSRRAALESDLRHALENREMALYYQPKIDLTSLRVEGFEALIRWIRPDGTVVSPADFIPVAEETGLIIPMGGWVVEEACRQIGAWRTGGVGDRAVSVNLSARQFQDPQLLATVEGALKAAGIPAALLEMEITESMVMVDTKKAVAVMGSLAERGIAISMDDFGTGYSSLSYLKTFPLSALKIDQSFVRDILDDPGDMAIVAAVISMAKSLGIRTVAEGVETFRHVELLTSLGADVAQGYHFARPLPAAEVPGFLEKFGKPS